MTPREHQLLSRYVDHELDAEEQREVDALLERDPSAAAQLEQLFAVGGLLAEAAVAGQLPQASRAKPPAIDADALFAGIEQRLASYSESEPESAPRALPSPRNVVSLEGRRPRRAVVPVLASLAAAAAALLVFLGPRATRERLPTGTPGGAEPPAAQLASASGSQIDDVDFGGSTGTVFEIDNEGVSAAVVWISDDDEESTP